MKNILLILLALPLFAIAQEQDPCYSINDVFNQMGNENPSITKDFDEGWNMFGYPCSQSKDVEDCFIAITDKIALVKDNNGSVYLPEFGFNGIGLLEGGEGYQIKMHFTVYGFSFCDGIVYPIIEGCTLCEALNFNRWATTDDGSCFGLGCTDEFAANYDSLATISSDCEYYNTYAIPDTAFLSWLQYNLPEVMVNDSLNVDSAANYSNNIYVYYTNIENLDGLQYFTNLSRLYIYENDILTSIPDLSGLTNLMELLIFDNNSLTSIPNLTGLTNLYDLVISGITITSIPDLSELTNLANLYIAGNDALTSVPNLSGLTNLMYLDISDNQSLVCVDGYPDQLTIDTSWPPVCPQ